MLMIVLKKYAFMVKGLNAIDGLNPFRSMSIIVCLRVGNNFVVVF